MFLMTHSYRMLSADAPALGTRRGSALGTAGLMSRMGQEAARGSPATPPNAAMTHLPGLSAFQGQQPPLQQPQAPGQQPPLQPPQQPLHVGGLASSIKRMPYTQQLQIPGETLGLLSGGATQGAPSAIQLGRCGGCVAAVVAPVG